jgi:hypothetical protein
MELLFPESRAPKRAHSWIVAACLCLPPLLAWAAIGLDWSGIWWSADTMLHDVPALAQAAVMLLSPLAAVVIGVVGLARGSRAGATLDRRLVALTVVGAVLTASAAWLGV